MHTMTCPTKTQSFPLSLSSSCILKFSSFSTFSVNPNQQISLKTPKLVLPLNPTKKIMTTHVKSSSPLPSCFRPSSGNHHRSSAAEQSSAVHNLSTSVHKTTHGLFSVTWCRNVLRRSFHLYILLDAVDGGDPSSSSTPSFSLNLKPFIFWNRVGSRKLNLTDPKSRSVQIFWDFSRVKFGLHPEPESGFYVAVVVDGSTVLLAGDSPAEAYLKTKSIPLTKHQSVVLRREHFHGKNLYTTKAQFGNRTREISINCRTGDDPRLYFSVDDKRVLQIKHLKWKFRGNERIEIDGVYVQISWDVYNWLFEEDNEDGYGLFMFRFQNVVGLSDDDDDDDYEENKNVFSFGSQQSCGFGFEKMKMRKSFMKSSEKGSSSSSLSSGSSTCSSVMEWASMEENELKCPSGFSLLLYAWKS